MDGKTTLLTLFGDGGWAMWPLLIFSISTIAIVIERLIFIFMHKLSVADLRAPILDKINDKNIKGAKDYCQSMPKKKLAAHIMLQGLEMGHLGEHRIEKVLETVASEKVNQLERGFNLLIAIGSLAPITGFLGTVSGMISAFTSIANATDMSAQLVAGGIREALITTAFGLGIAIVAITALNLYSHVVDKFTMDVEQLGSEMTTAIIVNQTKQ